MEAERRRNVENDSDGNMDDTSNSFFSAEDQSDVEQLKYDCASLPDSMDENMEGINVSHVEISSDADDVDDDDVSISSELMEVIGAINKLQIKPAVEIIHRLYATIASNNEPCGISRIEAHYALDWKENLSEEAKKMNCSTVSELLESEIMHDFIEFAAFDEKTHETLYRAKALPQTEHILQYLCESKLDEEQKKMKKIAERNIALRKPENQSNFIEGKRRILSLLLEMKAYENPVFYSDLQKIYLERFQKTLNEAELKRMFMRKKALKNFRLVFAKEVRIVCECPIQIMLVSADIELPTLMQEEDLDIVSGLTEVPVFPVSPFIAHCQTEISGYQKASLKKRTEPENRQKHLKFQETLMGKPATVNWNVTIEKCPEVNKRDQTCWRSDSSSENEQPVRFNETNGNQNHFTTRDSDGVYTDDEDDSGNAKNNVTMLKESDEKQSSKMVNKPATLARRSLINSTVSPSKGAEEESVNDGKIRQRVKPICMSVSYDVTNKDSKEYSVQPNETRPPPTLAVLGRRTAFPKQVSMSNCNVSGNIPNKPVSAVSDRKQYKENHFGGLPSARRSNSPQRPLSDQTGLLSRIAADDFLSSGKSETGTQTDDFLSYAYITEFLEESGILAASREAEAHASAESYQPVSKKDAELAEAVDFIVRFRHPNPITVNELSSLICGILGPSIRRFELPVSWANFVCRFCRNVWVDRISDDVCLRYGSSR